MSSPLTLRQMAERIGKSEKWIRRNRDAVPHHRFGRAYMFTPEDVAAFMAANQHIPTPREAAPVERPLTRSRRAA